MPSPARLNSSKVPRLHRLAFAAVLFVACPLDLAAQSPTRARASTDSSAARSLALGWRPVRDSSPEVVAVAVAETLSSASDPGAFSLRAPITYAGVRGIAERIQ